MARPIRALLLAAALCAAGHAAAELPKVLGEAAWPSAKRAETGLRLAAPELARAPVARMELPPPEPAALAALAAPEKRSAIGIARSVTPAAAPVWSTLADGRRVAHLQVRSASAAATRAGLVVRSLPAGARVRFAAADGRGAVVEQDGAEASEAVRSQGISWGPVVEGDTQVVEIELAPGADPGPVRFTVAQVSHLVAGPSTGFAKVAAATCQEDVACVAASNPAVDAARRAVVKMVYTENGATYTCTGTLVNDTDASSQIPYLHTASHCIASQAAAATLNTFWFYEASSCGGASAAPVQLTRGAKLLHANESTDVALLRLNDAAPAGAWFAGWNPNPPAASTPVVAIHHPRGDVKKVSIGQALGLATEAGDNLIAAAWIAGTTEPGSSGSGLFTLDGGQYLLRGGLKGGSASCASTGVVSNPANRDYYSRLDLDFAKLTAVFSAQGAPEADYSDLWWNPEEPGWGLSVVQHASNATMVMWFTYDEAGKPTWFFVSDCKWEGSRRCAGTAYRTKGSPWMQPVSPGALALESVGALALDFGAADDVSIRGTLLGVALSKRAVRQVF